MSPRRRRTGLSLAALLAALLAAPAPARAWDPSTTHLGMLERSVLDSAMHLRWMDASALQRGVFSPLRLDPDRLPDDTRRMLTVALGRVHAASGAQALGGPGTCPGASAPEATRAFCVAADQWEMTALGWLELGVIVETVPAQRLLHHFVDRRDPAAMRWTDNDLPRAVLRSKHAKAGGTVASRATGGGFEGSGRSALAWLEDPTDPWAPRALARHLHRASLAPDRAERDHHLALALLCAGALLHVVQDLSVPAHARGDLSAMFLPLSTVRGDRGLPIQELARDAYGRGGLPTPIPLSPRADTETGRGTVKAPTLRGHLLGHGDWPGLVPQVGGRFFSESSLPPPRPLDDALSPEAAASALLAGTELEAAERDGAHLSAWPAARGYLVGGRGQLLAAYRRNERDEIQLWLDRRVQRAQMQRLIPLGVETGRSVLDLVFAAWPSMTVDPDARTIELTPTEPWASATLLIVREDGRGRREAIGEVAMSGTATHRIVEAWPANLADDAQVVLVLRNPAGTLPAVAERVLDRQPAPADEASAPAPGGVVPRPRSRSTTRKPSRKGAPVRGLAPRGAAPRGDKTGPSSAPSDATPTDPTPTDPTPSNAPPEDPDRPAATTDAPAAPESGRSGSGRSGSGRSGSGRSEPVDPAAGDDPS